MVRDATAECMVQMREELNKPRLSMEVKRRQTAENTLDG